MQRSKHTFINAESAPQSKQLDELLWTFSQGSFVPHRIVSTDTKEPLAEPVLIACDLEPQAQRYDLMINLASQVPEFFGRYERVAELVDADQSRREHGRERYRFYRDRGYKLNTHQL